MKIVIALLLLARLAHAEHDVDEVTVGGDVAVGVVVAYGATGAYAHDFGGGDCLTLRAGLGQLAVVDDEEQDWNRYYDVLVGYRHSWNPVYFEIAAGYMALHQARVDDSDYNIHTGEHWESLPWFTVGIGANLSGIDLEIGLSGPSLGARLGFAL